MERFTLPSNGGESARRTPAAPAAVPDGPSPSTLMSLRASRALLQRTGFQGIAMVEYKHPPAGGAWTLMEINGRPWGSMHLPIHCGIDYPRYLVDWYLEGRIPPEGVDYRVGITCRWLLGDLVHLENLWNGAPDGWPVPYPRFWSSLLAVAVPWHPRLGYDDFMLGDLRPGLAELGALVPAAYQGKRLTRSRGSDRDCKRYRPLSFGPFVRLPDVS